MEGYSKGYKILSAMAGFSVVIGAVVVYMAYDIHVNKNLLSKDQFVCTQIEQMSRNLDDVVCVQYTHHKHSKAAMTVNSVFAQRQQ